MVLFFLLLPSLLIPPSPPSPSLPPSFSFSFFSLFLFFSFFNHHFIHSVHIAFTSRLSPNTALHASFPFTFPPPSFSKLNIKPRFIFFFFSFILSLGPSTKPSALTSKSNREKKHQTKTNPSIIEILKSVHPYPKISNFKFPAHLLSPSLLAPSPLFSFHVLIIPWSNTPNPYFKVT